MTVAEAKSELRDKMLARLRRFSRDDRAATSMAITRTLAAHPRVLTAKRILLFASLPSEPDLSQLPALVDTRWCLPRVRDEESMTFHQIDNFERLKRSAKNIREPNPDLHPEIDLTAIDLILVPGLAFSSTTHHRLGRGGGYYDRFFARSHAHRIAVCFPRQVLDEIPHEAHDLTVDEIAAS